jgi:hypothetical protein
VTLTKTSDRKGLKSSQSPECTRTVTYTSSPVTTHVSEGLTVSETLHAVTSSYPEDMQPPEEMAVEIFDENLQVEEELYNRRPRQDLWQWSNDEHPNPNFAETASCAAQSVAMPSTSTLEDIRSVAMPSTSTLEDTRIQPPDVDIVQLFLEKDQVPNQQEYYDIRNQAKTAFLETGRPELYEQMLTSFENKVRAQEQQLFHSKSLYHSEYKMPKAEPT